MTVLYYLRNENPSLDYLINSPFIFKFTAMGGFIKSNNHQNNTNCLLIEKWLVEHLIQQKGCFKQLKPYKQLLSTNSIATDLVLTRPFKLKTPYSNIKS